LDEAIFQIINGYAGTSDIRDFFVKATNRHLIKTMPIIVAFWYLWFRNPVVVTVRAKILVSLTLGVLSMAIGRGLSVFLPYSLRPIHQSEIPVNFPDGMESGALSGWSSMPSDHAVFNYTLCACLFLIHRKLGIWAFFHATLFIMLPRIYMGFHWPSDIAAGALVAVGIVVLLFHVTTVAVERLGVMAWVERYPQFFYPLFFLLSFQLSSNFDTLRSVVRAVIEGARQVGNL